MAFAQRKTVSAIKQENLGYGEKPDYLALKATINYIKHDSPPYYSACITENCNKKVSEVTHIVLLCP
jgi:replication factor A1